MNCVGCLERRMIKMATDVRYYALYLTVNGDASKGMGFYWDSETQEFKFEPDNGATMDESAQAMVDAVSLKLNEPGFLAAIRGE